MSNQKRDIPIATLTLRVDGRNEDIVLTGPDGKELGSEPVGYDMDGLDIAACDATVRLIKRCLPSLDESHGEPAPRVVTLAELEKAAGALTGTDARAELAQALQTLGFEVEPKEAPARTAAPWADVMRSVLQDWAEGAKGNCEAMDHRHDVGDGCWNTFTPEDIRRMIDDAERETRAH